MSEVYDGHSEGNQSYNNGDRSFNQNDPSSSDDIELLRMKYKQTNNRVYHDFYKTKMCSLFSLNICNKGKNCPFAHSMDELREKPNLQKTKLCDAFLQGECNKGDDCPFAHGEDELRSTPDLFKTAICNLWTQGRCIAGETCRFAHGEDDLRPAPSHQKFKAKQKKRTPKYPKSNGHPNPNANSNYYYNQVPYPADIYSYPMYPMSILPGPMQHPYMMGQPMGFYPQVQGAHISK